MPLRYFTLHRAAGMGAGFVAVAMRVTGGEPVISVPGEGRTPGLVQEERHALAFSVPEFRGVTTLGSVVSVALADGPEAPARWFPLGARVGDYRVVTFEAGSEVVVLASSAGELRLPLRKPHAASESGTDSASGNRAPSAGDIARVRENIAQLAIAAAHYLRISARSEVAVADLVGPGRMIDVLRPVAGEDYSVLRLTRAPVTLSVALADGTAVTLEPAAIADAAARYHLVSRSDTLAELARRADQPLGAVLELNELAAPDDALRAGRLLRLH